MHRCLWTVLYRLVGKVRFPLVAPRLYMRLFSMKDPSCVPALLALSPVSPYVSGACMSISQRPIEPPYVRLLQVLPSAVP